MAQPLASGRWQLWPLLAFLLLYNPHPLWGFNHSFGISCVRAARGAALEGGGGGSD
jgi:hypothetical protein